MISREVIKGGFGILMYRKCQVCGILPFGDFTILSKLHHIWPEHSDAPSEEPKP